jgi:hypothetical protein
MRKYGYLESFAAFGADLVNPQWAVSAIAPDGAIVISCWYHYFCKAPNGAMRYDDKLSRWKSNEPGNNLLKSHLKLALNKNLSIRLIVARTGDTSRVDQGLDASKKGVAEII